MHAGKITPQENKAFHSWQHPFGTYSVIQKGRWTLSWLTLVDDFHDQLRSSRPPQVGRLHDEARGRVVLRW